MGGILEKRERLPPPSNQDKTVPDFSRKEQRAIISTWELLQDKSPDLGTDIFLRIFELRPEVKIFFPFRNEVGDSLVRHPIFISHSMRFINAVHMTISNMDALELIHVPNLQRLGRYHTRIPGFTHDIFQVFYYAMKDVWAFYLGRIYSGEVRKAWCKVFKFIIDQVEIGYAEEVSSMKEVQSQTDNAHEKGNNAVKNSGGSDQ